MADIVLGIGTSHTPMLNATPEDWARFIERDSLRPHLDKQGNPVTYAQLVELAGPNVPAELSPEVFARKHARAMVELDKLAAAIAEARLDALVIVGDDQKELYNSDNQPSILVYHGDTIRNAPLRTHPGPDWSRRASARYYEPEVAKEYPVHTGLADHVIASLMANDFDISIADCVLEHQSEGHAFGFIHRRLLAGGDLPVLPVFLNTYYGPNQPTPRRCHMLGQAIARAIAAYPQPLRVGVIASGGLSHFTVDEELDGRVIRALRDKDAAALHALPVNMLNGGSSEIRNWICMAGATEHLSLRSLEYIPGYRTPGGTGTGLCFALWT